MSGWMASVVGNESGDHARWNMAFFNGCLICNRVIKKIDGNHAYIFGEECKVVSTSEYLSYNIELNGL